MQAITNTQYGPPSVLHSSTIARPSAGDGQVLVKVHASVVTQGDRRLRAADFPGVSALFGRLLIGVLGPRHPVGGSMFAGRVVEVGPGVTDFAVGDDVFGSVMHGAYAEYLVISRNDAMAKMPRNLSYGEAAAIPYGAGTALAFLRDMAKVQRDERVLVVGATGGVGRMAVQLAKHLGAEVTAVCGDDADLARELGADHVVDYRTTDVSESDERWDVIFDTTEGDHFRAFRRVLSADGRYLSLYLTPRVLWEMAVSSLGSGPRAIVGVAEGSRAQMDELRELVEEGALRPVVDQRFPLADIVEAHRYLESERPHGSVVVEVMAPAEAVTPSGVDRVRAA